MRPTPIIALACLLTAGLSGFTGWRVTLAQIPYSVIEDTTEYFIEIAGGVNTIFHLRRYGPGPGRIPRANPDVMTSMCVFDTSEGAVEIIGESWRRYWSVSLYSANGDNFYTLNDEAAEPGVFRILVDHRPSVSRQQIQSPNQRGIMVVRRFVPSEDEADEARRNQDSFFCRQATPRAEALEGAS